MKNRLERDRTDNLFAAPMLPSTPTQLARNLCFLANLRADISVTAIIEAPRKDRARIRALGARLHQITGDAEISIGCAPLLREFLTTWLEAAHEVAQWLLKTEFENYLGERTPHLYRTSKEPVKVAYWDLYREEEDVGGLPLRGATFKEVCRLHATEMFLAFIQSEEFRWIGRCERCAKFFHNRSRHTNMIYCSGPCARAASSLKTHQQQRREEHQRKIGAVNKALMKYASLSESSRSQIRNWKRWVANRAGVDITPNFITRAENKGELSRVAHLGLQGFPNLVESDTR